MYVSIVFGGGGRYISFSREPIVLSWGALSGHTIQSGNGRGSDPTSSPAREPPDEGPPDEGPPEVEVDVEVEAESGSLLSTATGDVG
jgi:hypothetical protein